MRAVSVAVALNLVLSLSMSMTMVDAGGQGFNTVGRVSSELETVEFAGQRRGPSCSAYQRRVRLAANTQEGH
jgi:hypothetical protein